MSPHTRPVPIALQTPPQHPAAAGQPWPDWGKGWLIPCPCGCVCWLGLGSESVGLSFGHGVQACPDEQGPFQICDIFCQLFFRGIPHSLFPSPAAWPKLTLALLLWEEEARRGAAAPRTGAKKNREGVREGDGVKTPRRRVWFANFDKAPQESCRCSCEDKPPTSPDGGGAGGRVSNNAHSGHFAAALLNLELAPTTNDTR